MAVAWLAEGTDRPYGARLRFDGIAMLLDSAGELVRLDHLEAAFSMLARESQPSRSTGSTLAASGSRPTSGSGCRRSPSSGSPTRRSGKRANAFGRRWSTRGSSSRSGASPSTSRRRPAQGRPGLRPAARGRAARRRAQLDAEATRRCAVVGELSLTGEVRSSAARCASPKACADTSCGCCCPGPGRAEAALVPEIEILGAGRRGGRRVPEREEEPPVPPDLGPPEGDEPAPDLADVQRTRAILGTRGRRRGRPQPALYGPPGTGKTMLARRLPSILPPLRPARSR